MRATATWIVLVVITLLVSNCGTGKTSSLPAAEENIAALPPSAGLPALPTGSADVKRSQLVDNDLLLGTNYIEELRTVAGGADVFLESEEEPGDSLSYALYQFTARPDPAVPYGLTVDCLFLDPDPLLTRPEEGFWVGYGDYDRGCWQFSGPHRTRETRIVFPAAANVTSPGGFIYCVVITDLGNRADLFQLLMGYYTTEGYDEHWLARPAGDSVGWHNDIQLDPAGQPQIGYLHGRSLTDGYDLYPRVARLDGGSWEVQDIVTGYRVQCLKFGIGDSGLRALVVIARDTNDLHLLWDGGDGLFDQDIVIEAAVDRDVLPSITFVNKDDDPVGPLNMALVVYAIPDVDPNVKIRYYTYDDAGVPHIADLSGATAQPGTVSLTRSNDQRGICGLPLKPGVDWELSFLRFQASPPAWAVLMGPAWVADEIHISGYDPAIVAHHMDSGKHLAAYVNKNSNGIIAGYYDNVSHVWEEDSHDRVPCESPQRLDFETYGTAFAAFPTSYGSYCPAVYIGEPSSGENWTSFPLDDVPYSCVDISMAVESDGAMHFASLDASTGSLNYYHRAVGGEITKQIVDNGAYTQGSYRKSAPMVTVGDHVHVFLFEDCHFGIRHAENVDGVWLSEAELVPTSSFPYMLLEAGYLETTNELWVTYLDAMDYSLKIVYGELGSGEWQTQPFYSAMSQYASFDDDETNVSAVTWVFGTIGNNGIGFISGPPEGGPYPIEPIVLDSGLGSAPWAVDYNTVTGQWAVLATAELNNECFYYERQPSGLWLGPYKVAEQPGTNGKAEAIGLSHRYSDGEVLAVVREQPNTPPPLLSSIYVYTAAAGSTNFTPTAYLKTYNATLEMTSYPVWAATPSGEPVVAICHKPIADLEWDIEAFAPDGLGGYPSVFDWQSPIAELGIDFGCTVAATAAGQPVITVIEHDNDLGSAGQALVYYPW